MKSTTVVAWDLQVGQHIVCRNRERTITEVFRHSPYVTVKFTRIGGCEDAHTYNRDSKVERVMYG